MNDPTKSRYRYLSFKIEKAYRRYVQINKKNISPDHPEKSNADIPAHGTYGPLLFRSEWKARRADILNRDKKCVICNGGESLQIHHRQYHFVVRQNKFKLPWEYPDHLLITLCESCHKRGHNKFKVPTINI